MPKKDKNAAKKFRDFHMQVMDTFMIIAGFETYTSKLNLIKPYSFPMFTLCILNENNNKLTYFTGRDCLDEFFDHFSNHVNRISKIKAKPNPDSNYDVYKSNQINTVCLICNNPILINKPHVNRYYCKKRGYLHGFRHDNVKEKNIKYLSYFKMVQSLILD